MIAIVSNGACQIQWQGVVECRVTCAVRMPICDFAFLVCTALYKAFKPCSDIFFVLFDGVNRS